MKIYQNSNSSNLGSRFLFSALFLLLAPISACKKFVTIPNPDNQVVSSAVFNDDNTATSAVLGLYSQMISGTNFIMNGAITIEAGFSADELMRTTSSSDYDPFINNALTSNSFPVQNNLWRYGYIFIYQANSCLEGLNASQSLSTGTKQQLTGEMLFMRSLLYFYMVNLFGDVPLILSTDYQVNSLMPRTPADQVYAQIIADLKTAQTLLTPNYPSAGQARPNKYAAAALLSRVYLYTKDYKNAELSATSVINSGSYSFLTDLNSVFLANSKEAILQLAAPTTGTLNTYEGNVFNPATATTKPLYILNNALLNAFESGDKRKTSWINANVISGVSYSYPYKYKVRSNATKTEYYTILRLAEQYLIRAEARAQQGFTTDAVADVNMTRQRAGLPALAATIAAPDLITAINRENRFEFFIEWGHRWLDLKRTNQADAVLSLVKPLWKSSQALYPIPFAEIQANNNLVQNPGY